MRVIQLIDSLHTGGAERVAVNFANALASKTEGSYICATREEGILKKSINQDVHYLFLNKKHAIDIRAIKNLNKFVYSNEIDIIHAHSSSFFLATIIKLLNRNVKIVWHDHYGNSEFLNSRKSSVLKFCSNYFSHVFSVNRNLETWARQYLKFNKVSYLSIEPETNLYGVSGKRIICLANLRPQKDHFTLINAFKDVVKKHPDWTLHFVGKDFDDHYSSTLKNEIKKLGLSKNVYLYNSKPDIANILSQCEIGVLSSKSEGLPIALLEYGLANLSVITTRVGECESVVECDKYGILINPESIGELKNAILFLIKNKDKRMQIANSFSNKVEEQYSSHSIMQNVLLVYNSLLV